MEQQESRFNFTEVNKDGLNVKVSYRNGVKKYRTIERDFLPSSFTQMWLRNKEVENTVFEISLPEDIAHRIIKAYRDYYGILNLEFNWQQYTHFKLPFDKFITPHNNNIFVIDVDLRFTKFRTKQIRKCGCTNKPVWGWRNNLDTCVVCDSEEYNKERMNEIITRYYGNNTINEEEKKQDNE